LRLLVPIGSERMEMEVTVARVADLVPHEEVLPQHLRRLVEAFAASRFQHNPVVVDSRTGLILDGTHRWAAMRELGFEWIAVCKVDYMSPLIEVDSWARLFEAPRLGERALELALEGFGARPVEVDDVEPGDLAVVALGRAFRIPCSDARESFEKLRSLERILVKLTGREPAYLPRASWRRYVSTDRVMLLPPRVRKEDVVGMALAGLLLPPKSTRHIVPARPVGINLPTRMLRDKRLDAELVEELLRQRRPVLLRPPVTLDREYDELLVMFC